ncbi:SprT family zinc-dependent metalloprotease [Streptomyces griseoviridis]|uniref:SprT family zinc-dependent metalloprotease n=1 Tax=Streptomyces hintoniae TaxID=3075521 RepID=A0ABU2UFK6_9ACTN|nr:MULTISPECIES: SprT family zinc-dependent metalloprotease [unclassified Streptomyces]MDH6700315.1 putative metal-dependent hydrolase [Streptomyces sp. MAA16]MDT0471796.1 SprT family zinc-dependent metalloprotease [Streptomyces sp. DSM 41014]
MTAPDDPVHEAIASLPLPDEWDWELVVRPRRRTLGIDIAPDGRVRFAAPQDADPREVADAVRSRLPRLADEVRRRRRHPAEPVKELVDGTGFAYLGRRYRLSVVPADEERPRVRLHRGRLVLPAPVDRQDGGRRITDWYTERGTDWLAVRLPSYAGVVGVAPRALEVRDLGTHWGACGPDGTITVHWAVLQLSPALVDLVLFHELCHLRAPGHGIAFHGHLRRALPDAEERERLFADEEPGLWRGAVR